MELFKHAIFTGEFEREECRVEGIERTDDRNLLLLRVEAPPTNHLHRLPLDAQPQEYFAVKGATVAEILSERDALPGRAEDWAAFAQFPRDAAVVKEALRTLAHIPYFAFPARGQAILGGVLLTKVKVRVWMGFKGYELPQRFSATYPSRQIAATRRARKTRTPSRLVAARASRAGYASSN